MFHSSHSADPSSGTTPIITLTELLPVIEILNRSDLYSSNFEPSSPMAVGKSKHFILDEVKLRIFKSCKSAKSEVVGRGRPLMWEDVREHYKRIYKVPLDEAEQVRLFNTTNLAEAIAHIFPRELKLHHTYHGYKISKYPKRSWQKLVLKAERGIEALSATAASDSNLLNEGPIDEAKLRILESCEPERGIELLTPMAGSDSKPAAHDPNLNEVPLDEAKLQIFKSCESVGFEVGRPVMWEDVQKHYEHIYKVPLDKDELQRLFTSTDIEAIFHIFFDKLKLHDTCEGYQIEMLSGNTLHELILDAERGIALHRTALKASKPSDGKDKPDALDS